MLSDLTKPQRALADYMSFLSEEAYDAAWMQDLEFQLWRALKGEIKEYGRLQFTSNSIATLENLSLAAKGWIYFHVENEETFVSFDEWEQRLA